MRASQVYSKASPQVAPGWVWMVRGLIATAFGLAANYCLSAPARFSYPAFDTAKGITDRLPGEPMLAWGLLFLVGACSLLACRISRKPRLMIFALMGGVAVYTFWALVFLVAALTVTDPVTGSHVGSFATPILYGTVALAHFSCLWTLASGQRQ